MSLLAKLCSADPHKAGKLALFCIWLIVAAIEVYYILPGSSVYSENIRMLGSLIADSIERSSTKNSRGDTVEAETVGLPGPYDPDPTIIRLRRARHWLSTTLLKAESYGLHYCAEWLDDNTVEVRLVFGCLVHLNTPVTTVGPIHVIYRLSDGDRTLGSCPPGVSPRPEKLPARVP